MPDLGLGGLRRLISAFRHRRGFGVHSPFAYNLIREGVAESQLYGYYAYEKAGMGRHERRLVRLRAHLEREGIARDHWRYRQAPSRHTIEQMRRMVEREGGVLLVASRRRKSASWALAVSRKQMPVIILDV